MYAKKIFAKYLGNINVVLAFIFMGLILLIEPTMQIFKMEVNSIGLYASDFMKMSTYTDPFVEGIFSGEWTVFYWGWWIAFLPMMGMFVGKISRGRTIRNVMWGQLLYGALGCCCSFMIFGGLEAVKTISVLTGLPLVAVLIALMASVKRMLKEDEENRKMV